MWFKKPIKVVQHSPNSKYYKVMALLKTKQVVTNWELNKITFRYGAVIHDMRKKGFNIVTKRIGRDGLFTYQCKDK